MREDTRLTQTRGSGILLPVFSLPSAHGIGTLGAAAYAFVDFLAAARQRWWQVLPLGHTGYGDSPYQCVSVFAGNPYFIDLELLAGEGLLTRGEIEEADAPQGTDGVIDYGRLYATRETLLRAAFARGRTRDAQALRAFEQENAAWLSDYALYMALKKQYGMRPWTEWPDEDVRLHELRVAQSMAAFLREDVEFYSYTQYLFFKQWQALKAYANGRGIGIIGDMPIYASADSADVWARRENFQLDGQGRPTQVAGVPPDYFSADGQLWGNPLYDWSRLRADGYDWWLRRLRAAGALYDAVRIDHFRGFESYWAVPAGDANARNGRWVSGPGMEFLQAVRQALPDVPLIAEDLGVLTDGVRALLRDAGLPGMRVLEFAFDAGGKSSYLPHAHVPNCICYTGTHDNAPLAAWWDALDAPAAEFAAAYLGLNREEGFVRGLLRAGMASVAGVFIAQMQDWLELGAGARINTPGTAQGNWRWRLRGDEAGDALAREIAQMTRRYGRAE